MKIGYTYYEFRSPELRATVTAALRDRQKVRNAWAKFAKSVGGSTRKFVIQRDRLTGVLFKDGPPSTTQWKPSALGGWSPKGNTARKIYKTFKELPYWSPEKIEKAVNWSDIWDDHYVYFFNWFNHENGFCGITVPVFDDKDQKKLGYKPVKGMKEISWKMHNKKSVMSKKEYAATL